MEDHKTKAKRAAKNTAFLYVRLFILMLIGLYTSRVTLDVLGVNDFGIYNLVGGIITATSFINGAMALAVNRYLAYAMGKNDLAEMKRVFSMSVNLHLIIAGVVLILGETIGLWFINTQLIIPDDRIMAANWIYQASILSFIASILITPYSADVIAHEKMNFYAFTGILNGILKLIVVLILPFVLFDKLIIYAVLLSIVAAICALVTFTFVRVNFVESKYHLTWNKPLFKDMAKYAGFSTFGNMATAVVNQGQSVLLNVFYGPALNAVRGIALQVNGVVSQFVQGIYTAVTPQITKSYAENDRPYMIKMIYYSTLLTFALIFTIVLPLSLEIDFVLSVWLKKVPEYTDIFVRLVLINSIVYYFATPSVIGIQSSGNVAKIHLYTGSFNLMNLVVVYAMWKNFRMFPYTIFIVQILISFSMLGAIWYLQRSQLNISMRDYGKKVFIPAIVPAFFAAILPMLLHMSLEKGFARFLIVCVVSVLSSICCFYFIGLDRKMRVMVKDLIMSKVRKNG